MKYRGFTLIELLVVISIIALLSSVVLASLNTAREKGRIAGGKNFAAQVDHIASDFAVGMWEFDECSGSSTLDRSGNGNTASLGAGVGWSTDTPIGSGCSLSFAGTGSGTLSGLSSLQASDVTMSAWINPSDLSALRTVIAKEMQYKYRLNIGGTLSLLASCNGSAWSGSVTTPTPLVTGKWQQVVAVVDSVNQRLSLYIDGKLGATNSLGCSIAGYNGTAMYVGAYNSTGEPFVGTIDAARVYAKTLSASEIGKIYAAEAPRYGLANE